MSCREKAEQFIVELLSSGRCEKAEIAGSLRRGVESSHDVDIVCADPSLRPFEGKHEEYVLNGCNIDLRRANPQHYGSMMLKYTGPKGSVVHLAGLAKQKGWKFSEYGLTDRETGEVISTDEYEIRELLGRPYKKPEERGK